MAYSVETRKVVVTAYSKMRNFSKVAENLGMNRRTVRSIVLSYEEHGQVLPVKLNPGGRKPKITSEAMSYLKQEIQAYPALPLIAMVQLLKEKFGIEVCQQAIDKRLKSEGIKYKKKRRDLLNVTAIGLND